MKNKIHRQLISLITVEIHEHRGRKLLSMLELLHKLYKV